MRNPLAKVKVSNLKKNEYHMDNKAIIASMKDIIKTNKTFLGYLEKLRLPTIFSIMALLSNDKVNLFNDSLVELM